MFENIFGIATIPSIIIICYLIAMGIRTTVIDNKYIPVICGVLGGILGVLAMFLVPDYPASDHFTAIAIGIVSGLSSTGINQIFKQLGHNDIKGEE